LWLAKADYGFDPLSDDSTSAVVPLNNYRPIMIDNRRKVALPTNFHNRTSGLGVDLAHINASALFSGMKRKPESGGKHLLQA
jgi:hypothetical protein